MSFQEAISALEVRKKINAVLDPNTNDVFLFFAVLSECIMLMIIPVIYFGIYVIGNGTKPAGSTTVSVAIAVPLGLVDCLLLYGIHYACAILLVRADSDERAPMMRRIAYMMIYLLTGLMATVYCLVAVVRYILV